MRFEAGLRQRRSVRLRSFDYSSAGAYFITICTRDRLCTLGSAFEGQVELSGAGVIVQEIWESLPVRFLEVDVDAFVVMPNHVHGIVFLVGAQFVAPEPRPASRQRPLLGEVVRTFKAAATSLIRSSGTEDFGWQRGYYEHIIRNDADLDRIREYIDANPLRWDEDPENPAVLPNSVRDEMSKRLRAR